MSGLNPDSVPMFAGLPSAPQRRRAFLSSYVLQALGLALLVEIGIIHPAMIARQHQYVYVSLAPPVPVNHTPQRIPPKLLAPKIVPPPRTEMAKLETPPPPKLDLPAPKPELADVKPPVAKPVPTFPAIAAAQPSPRPSPQIKTGSFSSGSSATPTAIMDARKVQTGGFGDPNGVPAGNNTSGRVNIAAAGSFDLPQGEGYGNGTGGKHGARAVVASAGFGNGVATGSGGGPRASGAVKDAGFGNSAPVQPAPHSTEPAKDNTAPVQIISKPKPTYTAEARAAHIEGEVLLEVVFTAAGHVRVVRVVRGLGHGLDESAIRAAEQIRYKPATRGGSPVDFAATVHIVFQMA